MNIFKKNYYVQFTSTIGGKVVTSWRIVSFWFWCDLVDGFDWLASTFEEKGHENVMIERVTKL